MANPVFVPTTRPLLVSMLQAESPRRVMELMEKSRALGAEAYGMQFCKLKKQYRSPEISCSLLEAALPLPVYVTNYRTGENKNLNNDELLAKELLELADCGASLCDVMGDYFAPCPGELTSDKEAVKKQEALIDALHQRGAQVLMSSHVMKFIPAEEVLAIAKEHQRRGADVAKIVTGAETPAEELENLRILHLLKEEMEIPFLFLGVGKSYLSRRLGGTLGNCMSLCVCEHDLLSTKSQPLLEDMKKIRDLMEEKA